MVYGQFYANLLPHPPDHLSGGSMGKIENPLLFSQLFRSDVGSQPSAWLMEKRNWETTSQKP